MSIDRSLLSNLPLFRGLDGEGMARVLLNATLRDVARGETVFDQGAPAERFYLLLRGRLKVSQVTPDGQQVMVRIVHPGDLFGFARALNRPDYPGTARAVVDSTVTGWPMEDWPAVVEASPPVAASALRTLGKRLDEAHTRLRELSTEEVERRIAHTVLRLADRAGRVEAEGIRLDFPISRQDVAQLSGTTLHTASRILSAWEGRGWVAGGRQRLTVVDRAALARLADPEI
ncbi:Crp/Fnr family transcriptional regulator [Paenirhodobacter sp.]|uniref:Crp/Fnr family transcriptional regulator n=1 Tax=Paenirhodobacter sp. TaxID=1965326 RepID=UPI003B3E071A